VYAAYRKLTYVTVSSTVLLNGVLDDTCRTRTSVKILTAHLTLDTYFIAYVTSVKTNSRYLLYRCRIQDLHILSNSDCCTMNNFVYPRTGKRGVPQQFPRRLYEMLENESPLAHKGISTSKGARIGISWSECGQAFYISEVSQFTTLILPKYFRTSKFSSFQRNLNLVSFYLVGE